MKESWRIEFRVVKYLVLNWFGSRFYASRFDFKMIFEKHLRSVSRAAFQRLGILRKYWRVLHDRLLLGRCFRSFVLPVLEYCSAMWCSAADTYLKLLDHIVTLH